MVRPIAAHSQDQTATTQRNSARCDRLLHFHGINLYQMGAIRCAWTDWCASPGSICNNSAQFGALRRIAALSRVQSVTIQNNSARCNGLVHFRGGNMQQFGTIQRACTNCCTFTGSICNNSAQFGAHGRIGALRLNQSVKIRHNSAWYDRLLHIDGINL